MSVLAHYLEDEGLATTALSLIRVQTEKVRPPRALWVPYELGRPLGVPNDPAFQRRVLLALLRLLERDDGPGLLVDYEEESPNAEPDPNWAPPVDTAAHLGQLRDPREAEEALLAEVDRLGASYVTAFKRAGRTTMGVSRLTREQAARCLAAHAAGRPMASPFEDISDLLLMRFAADDLKAYYLEAATAPGGNPSSGQLTDWLWRETILAKLLLHIRSNALARGDAREKIVAGRFLVPAHRAAELAGE